MVNADITADSEPYDWARAVPLLLLLGLFLFLDLAIATFFEVDSDTAAGFVIGSMFAQIVVAAVWISMGPMLLLPRVIMGITLIGVATICMFVCALRDAGEGNEIAFVLAAAMLVQAVLYQLPLWVARFQGWQLTLSTAELPADPHGEFQFGLRQLMIWTTLVAVFLAAGRLLLSGFSVTISSFDDDSILLFAVFSLFNVLLAFPIIWGCFVHRLVLPWMILAAVWCCILTPVELWVIGMFGPGGDDEVFVLVNLTQLIAAASVLFSFRLAGFRLRHRGPPRARLGEG